MKYFASFIILGIIFGSALTSMYFQGKLVSMNAVNRLIQDGTITVKLRHVDKSIKKFTYLSDDSCGWELNCNE